MKKGTKLEDRIAEELRECGDQYARRTRASGASTEIGDVYSSWFYVEAKEQHTHKNPTILRKAWDKLLARIPVHKAHEKPPIYVVEDGKRDIFVCILLEDFIKLVKKGKE